MSRYQPDHYDVCDTIRLECGERFCPDHDTVPGYVQNPEDFDPRFPSLLHERGVCAECDSCWVDVDANLAYDAEIVSCPSCDGKGEHGINQDYFGNWNTRQCWGCAGMGEVTRSLAADISAREAEGADA